MSIKTRMSVIACCLVAGFLVLTAVPAYIYISSELKRQISSEQFALARYMAAHFDDNVDMAREKIAKCAAALNPAEVNDPAGLREFLEFEQELQTFFDQGMYVIRLDGTLVAATSRDAALRKISPDEIDLLVRGKAVSNACASPHGPIPCLTVAAPIRDRSGSLVAVLAGRLDVTKKHFLGELTALKVGSDGYAYVIDSRRTLIMHTDRIRILETLHVGANEGIEKALHGFEGTVENTNASGVRGLTSFKRLSSAGWILAVHLPLQEAYDSLYRVRFYFGIMLAAAMFCSAMVVWFVMGRVVAPLLSLTRHVRDMAEKNGADRLVRVDTPDEIGDLARAFNGMVRKIEQQRGELERAKDFHLLLFEEFPTLIWRMGLDGRCNYLNRTWFEFTGRRSAEALGDGWLEDIHPDDRPEVEHCFAKAFAARSAYVMEYRLLHRNGEFRWIEDNGRPFNDLDGNFAGYIGFSLDITERMRAVEALRESERFARSTVDALSSHIAILDATGTIVAVNKAWREFVLANPPLSNNVNEGANYLAVCDAAVGEDAETAQSFAQGIRNVLEGKAAVFSREYSCHSPEEKCWFVGRVTRFSGDGPPLVVVAHENVTVRKLAEEELARSREELVAKHKELKSAFLQVAQGKKEWELTLDCIGDLVIMADAAGRVRRCNRAVTELARKPVDELIGRPWPEVVILPEVETDSYANGGGEIHHRETNRWFLLTSYPFTGTGTEKGAVITLHDVTEAKRSALELEQANTELKETQSQMLQREKMASIGQLAAGVAHEINNPMGFITSNLGTLRKYGDKLLEFMAFIAEKAESHLDLRKEIEAERRRLKIDYVADDLENLITESLEGAERVRKIVADLKSFSRVDEAEYKVVDLTECLDSTINIVWNELKYKATLKKEYGELPPLRCYPQQLNQVFMNLLVNAAHAIETQGEITVRTRSKEGWVSIAIEDNGCGIPDDVMARIFEPFFTTKEVGRGTGLGLSISYDIVKKHGGEITVTSEQGKGTTFVVRLPSCAAGQG
ncbi:sensor histidine kinase, Cache_1, HAMP, PAS and PAS domain-containing [Geobacter metallireducens GS-15]|uniref:histidine kinase n=2 Tax=Geobacter metallireducens TaxID=28232 RepID=Q39PY8_GEOMG|nr:PAS domain S-box protein [Geobacter metallireducens]ABB33686.1 sensor histidine kinase, Cache_1, HAMP, PAS and PAS domain-containing [Geobacter metallireducens GS-15]